MEGDIRCASCGDKIEPLGQSYYCDDCKAAIQAEADASGISFSDAVVKLNVDRNVRLVAPDTGGKTTPDYERADWDYHGERRYDV